MREGKETREKQGCEEMRRGVNDRVQMRHCYRGGSAKDCLRACVCVEGVMRQLRRDDTRVSELKSASVQR